ncbi:MAG: flagellar biosynthetic protein FliO [Rhodospirillales bacterium]|nr:flagellar biosynthetic protein FliO [Rhodospirillales bacterium]
MEFGGYLRFLFALLFVLGLIGAATVMARRFGLGFPAAALKGGRNKRLSIVEVTQVDGRRRLVLVRRDNTEHLLLLGPNSELLIESGITPSGDLEKIEDKT